MRVHGHGVLLRRERFGLISPARSPPRFSAVPARKAISSCKNTSRNCGGALKNLCRSVADILFFRQRIYIFRAVAELLAEVGAELLIRAQLQAGLRSARQGWRS